MREDTFDYIQVVHTRVINAQLSDLSPEIWALGVCLAENESSSWFPLKSNLYRILFQGRFSVFPAPHPSPRISYNTTHDPTMLSHKCPPISSIRTQEHEIGTFYFQFLSFVFDLNWVEIFLFVALKKNEHTEYSHKAAFSFVPNL